MRNNIKPSGSLQAVYRSPILKKLRWLIGLLLAGIVTIGLAFVINHHKGSEDISGLNGGRYLFVTIVIPSLALGGFVFLSCLFVPAWRKYAAMSAVVFGLLFTCFGIYQHSMDDGYLARQYIIRYACFIIALIIGYFLGYKVFKINKWTSFKKF